MTEWMENLHSGYSQLAKDIVESGGRVAPRGQLTAEWLDATLVMDDPAYALPTHCGRKVHVALAALEALQLIAGCSMPELMTTVAPNTAQFLEPEGHFHGAYGPRIKNQIPQVISTLKRDPDSRQGVIVIWEPYRDLLRSTPPKDLPCTVMFQFMVRENRLQLHTTMRSNDVWWGLPYDAFQFGQLQLSVAHALEMPCGSAYHHVVSLHAYAKDWKSIAALTYPETEWYDTQPWTGVGRPGMSWEEIAERADLILNGQAVQQPTVTEERMIAALRPYL